jgi:preprotein translocase subunit YajC
MLALVEDAEPTGGGGTLMFPLIAMGAIFYFVLIAPERKARKNRQAMLDAVEKGDRIMTTGGIYGVVRKVEEAKIHVMVNDRVCRVFARSAVQSVIDEEGNTMEEAPKPG